MLVSSLDVESIGRFSARFGDLTSSVPFIHTNLLKKIFKTKTTSFTTFGFVIRVGGDLGISGQRRNLLLRIGELLFDLQLELSDLLLQLLLLLQYLLDALLEVRRGSGGGRALDDTGRVRRGEHLLLELLQLRNVLLQGGQLGLVLQGVLLEGSESGLILLLQLPLLHHLLLEVLIELLELVQLLELLKLLHLLARLLLLLHRLLLLLYRLLLLLLLLLHLDLTSLSLLGLKRLLLLLLLLL